jgi:fluoride exporter
MKLLLAIAAGGAFGALSRHFVTQQAVLWFGLGFPWGVLAVNVLGSFLLGLVAELSALAWTPSPALRAMIVVGFCGAFTTFSAFSLDVALLYERGDFLKAGSYIAASVVLSIGALFCGMAIIRSVYS